MSNALKPGTVIETERGPLAVTGCSSWPGSELADSSVLSTVDDAGEVFFLRRSGDGWTEVYPAPAVVVPA
jgi:hypothetical protein